MEEKKQYDLFGNAIKKDWEKEWKDMPEFIQENKSANRQIIISFKSQEDVDAFSKLIGQKFTSKTKSIWFPKVENEIAMNKRWTTQNES